MEEDLKGLLRRSWPEENSPNLVREMLQMYGEQEGETKGQTCIKFDSLLQAAHNLLPADCADHQFYAATVYKICDRDGSGLISKERTWKLLSVSKVNR